MYAFSWSRSLQPHSYVLSKCSACRYLSEKLLSVLASAYNASSRLVMGATHDYQAKSHAAWEQYSAQHPEVSGLLQSQVTVFAAPSRVCTRLDADVTSVTHIEALSDALHISLLRRSNRAWSAVML